MIYASDVTLFFVIDFKVDSTSVCATKLNINHPNHQSVFIFDIWTAHLTHLLDKNSIIDAQNGVSKEVSQSLKIHFKMSHRE